MTKLALSFRRLGLKLSIMALLALPSLAGAQYFTDTGYGDVDLGIRKTGAHAEATEIVSYLGNVTNYLTQPAGTTLVITNFNKVVLTNMCPDGFNFLQWSVFSSFSGPENWTNALGIWPDATCWYTVPRTNVNVQSKPVNRFSPSAAPSLQSQMLGVPDGALTIGSTVIINVGVTNNAFAVLEPISAGPQNIFDAYIGAGGNFGGTVFTFSVENNTSNSFTAPTISDFYQNCPTSTKTSGFNIDPITGLTNGPAYYVGYFTFSPNGAIAFTRAFGITASTTNGPAPLKVGFSTTATNTTGITNWVWNFGNGTSVTNTTGANVTNTYAAAGTYSVTLTVYGPNGSSTVSIPFIVVTQSGKPLLGITQVGAQFVISGTNGPASQQYRILTSTNVQTALASWRPIYTNTVNSNSTFGYTNTIGDTNSFFIMVSP
jgi:hypothetical protein